jgi:hypothetical protein
MGVYTGPASTVTAGQTSGVAAAINGAVNGVNAFGATTSYTPSWTAATNPAIGNGTIVGSYTQVEKTVYFRVVISFGSTTTFGSGAYTITLPTTATGTGRLAFPGLLYNGSTLYSIVGHVATGGANMLLYYQSVGTTGQISPMSGTLPVGLTAAAGNTITIHGVYESV